MKLNYRHFRAGSFTSWEEMLADVAQFCTSVGPASLLAITQSEDKNSAVVTVWHRDGKHESDARLAYRIFRGGALTPWEQIFDEAAAFASQVAPDKIASISQSEDKNDGLVVIWYWT